MWHIGLDVHQMQSTICILDKNGKRIRRQTIRGRWDILIAELRKIKKPFAICFEASTGYGYLFEQLSKIAKRVLVAHPGQLRLIFRSKRKNDRVDAEKLAKLLYLDAVPTVYVPSVDIRSWRSTIEHRQQLIRERTRTKNAIRALLRTHGIASPRRLWSKSNLKWLSALTFPTSLYALQRDMLLERYHSLAPLIERTEAALEKIANAHPGVNLLMTIPGVGIRTAEAVVAYIDKPERFTKNKAIGRYFGVIPSQDASAGANRLGHITRDGPSTVRKVIAEAAWQGIRRSSHIRAYFERIQQKKKERRKIALVATAHYLLRVMLAMLQTGETWRYTAA